MFGCGFAALCNTARHATVDPTHGWLLQMTVVVEPQNHTAITVATGRPAMNASWLHENRVVVNS